MLAVELVVALLVLAFLAGMLVKWARPRKVGNDNVSDNEKGSIAGEQ
jgi:hypothetical protein